ncbi:sigma 54-interacting transcriptional regulator [Wukongibacter baidiensis]|uniref:sigma-54 interaction domain-containing protein n=1 Tax=Wukongibacter baidiensis TaxID=1723361 RepID=UPI003D7FA596
MSSLRQIKDVVQQFAETASAALKLDVEVVDENFCWVAGSGRIKNLIGTKIIEQGIISKLLLKGRKNVIVDRPGEEESCKFCPNYGKCRYKKAVYSIIKNEEETIGVIGFSAESKEQEKLIDSNAHAMLDFIDKIGNLISAKVKEYEMLKQVKTYAQLMNTVIDNINKGIIILNRDDKIMDVNRFIEEKLQINKEEIKDKHIKKILPKINIDNNNDENKPMQYREISRTVKGKHIDLLYIAKPIVVNEQSEGTICLFEDYKDTKQLAYTISQKQSTISFDQIIGENRSFSDFKEKVKQVAQNDSTVLLTGETGTGKELFARAIHESSKRSNKPFIAINCGAIPEALIESELFGYEKGAFTGANKMGKHGKFYLADKGTLFLDEVGTMPIYLQIKLLRAIERREIERVGGAKSIPIDVRIIAATNEPLNEMVEKGEFREDLYHRLNVVTLFIPSLRERGEDILVLANHFISKYASKFNKYILGLSEEVKDIFLNYDWKGNVRELQNTIEYAINMESSNYITKENLPFQFKEITTALKSSEFITLEELEKQHIKMALDKCGWTENGRIEAAKKLGISRATIYRKIKKYNLA